MIANDPDVPNNAHIDQVISKYLSKLESLKSEVVAVTQTQLDTKTDHVRSRETSMGNLLADIVKETFQAEVAIIQVGSVLLMYLEG